jgi:hypothetical protein
MYYMTPTCHSSWTSKGLIEVLRDTLPLHAQARAAMADAPTATRVVPMLDDVDARQARIDRMGQRLKHLVQVADVPADSAVSA